MQGRESSAAVADNHDDTTGNGLAGRPTGPGP